MPTIAAGATSSITLSQDQKVLFSLDQSESASYVVTRGGSAIVAGGVVTGSRSLGPFESGDVMSITADRGAVDYTLSTYIDPSPSSVAGDLIEAPSNGPTAAVGAAGSLTGAYYYTAVFRTDRGLTAPWPGTGTVVNPSSQQVNLTAIPIGPAGTIARLIYRNKAGGADVKDYYFLTEIPDNTTTTYTDNTADGSLGDPVNWNGTNRGLLSDGLANVARFSDQSTSLGQGTFEANVGYASTAIGYQALNANTTGRRNTGVGVYALTSLTTGYQNTALGVHAGNNLTTGFSCTLVGYNAGFNNTTVEETTAIGFDALGSQTQVPARRNTAIGARTMASIAGAYTACTALGYAAGKYLDANYQVSIDCGIDRSNTSGNKNVSLIFGQGTVASPQTQYLYLNGGVRLGWDAPTVSQLPAASATLRGCRAYVTDASVTYASANLGSTVAGGGANVVPVFCNGSAWVIG